jgi:hypothetical protein
MHPRRPAAVEPWKQQGTETDMTDNKKKGDFNKNGKKDKGGEEQVGGNKKQDNSDNGSHQNQGHGGRR